MSSVKVPAQPKPLPKTARSKVLVCLPGYLCFTDSHNLCKLHPRMIVLFAKPVQHQYCTVKNNSSPFRIQMPIFHKPIHDEIYEAMVARLIIM